MTSIALDNSSASHWQIEDKRFYRWLLAGCLLWLVFGLIVPALNVPERSRELQEQLPPQLARVMLEQRQAPPPPEPEVVEQQPEPEPVIEPAPEPEPVEAVAQPQKPDPELARKQAEQSGLLAMQDDLADLRQSFKLNNQAPKVKSQGQQQAAQVERELIRDQAAQQFATEKAAAVSGDIQRTTLSDSTTTNVARADVQGLAEAGAGQAKKATSTADNNGPQGRAESQIRQVLEANKSSLYTLYSRALRANPLLKGKVVFALVIKPDGSLAEVKIVRSELNDPKLERQLTLRLQAVNFGAEPVALTRSQWTVEFLPG